MTEPHLLTIGQLARRSGVPVRTIRFWSDEGVLPETGRTRGNYRCYDAAAVARLDLVRTLRELGLGLDEVRLVLERQRTVEDVAAAHVRVIDTRIRTLRTQRAVCTLLSRGPSSARKATLMNDLAKLSAAERQQLIDGFVDAAFAGIDPDAPGAGIAEGMRRLPPELPDDPTTEQVEAWLELAELAGDPTFLARVREMTVAGAQQQGPPPFESGPIVEQVGPAVSAGVAPDSTEGRALVERLTPDLDAAGRAELADTITTFTDRRVVRYWQLLGVLNGWAPVPNTAEPFEWFAAALRAWGA